MERDINNIYINLKTSARNIKRTLKITISNIGTMVITQRMKINLMN